MAIVVALAGLAWFAVTQRRGRAAAKGALAIGGVICAAAGCGLASHRAQVNVVRHPGLTSHQAARPSGHQRG